MIVELEIHEDDEGLASYSGEVDEEELKELLDGTYKKPYLKLDRVFWTYEKKPDNEWEQEEKKLMRYGQGDHENYVGSLYVKTERIIYVHPLKSIAPKTKR